MLEYTSAQGLPTTLWLFGLFAFTPDVMHFGMAATFLCLFVESVVTYKLALKFSALTQTEALSIAALSLALPLFNAAQDFPVIGLIFFRMLFLIAALIAAFSLEEKRARHWLLRIASVSLLFLCCITNGALLVFYGGFYILLFFRYQKLKKSEETNPVYQFLLRYPDYFLLPPVTWLIRFFCVHQSGWYENYNVPVLESKYFGLHLWSFFRYVLPYHFRGAIYLAYTSPVLTLATLGALISYTLRGNQKWNISRSDGSNRSLVSYSALLLLMALLPLVLVGKRFEPIPISDLSRHCILVNIPVAIFLFAAVRWFYFRSGNTYSKAITPTITSIIILSGIQLNSAYMEERVNWIFNRSMLHNSAKNTELQNSSIVVINNFKLNTPNEPIIYTIYGFASTFGEMSRYVTASTPKNTHLYGFPSEFDKPEREINAIASEDWKYFTPTQMFFTLQMTSILQNEFKQINPSGRQISLRVIRNRGNTSDFGIIIKDLKVHYFGTKEEFDAYQDSLTTLKVRLLKEATPLQVGARPTLERPPKGTPKGNFTNGAGLSMIQLPEGWWAGKFEVTQAEYERLMGTNPSVFKEPQHPVECVSWHAAMEFCRRLTELERTEGRLPVDFVYRLPTVKEWDLLATGSKSSEAVLSRNEVLWQSAPVGSKQANPLGLYDVIGNVWEWCLDWSDTKQLYKVSKGGGWINDMFTLSPYPGPRNKLDVLAFVAQDKFFGPVRKDYPDQGFWDRGFRCVLAPITP